MQNKSADELFSELKAIAHNTSKSKIELILKYVENDGNTIRDHQESRDFITQSLARCLERQKEEITLIDLEIERMLPFFDYKLTTMPGIGTATASKLIAEIGDIRRFPNANQLARYAGVAPVKFSSAGKGKEESVYYQRKISEGKTKSQALVCIMRRLVNIVYGMMKNKTEYREPASEQ